MVYYIIMVIQLEPNKNGIGDFEDRRTIRTYNGEVIGAQEKWSSECVGTKNKAIVTHNGEIIGAQEKWHWEY